MKFNSMIRNNISKNSVSSGAKHIFHAALALLALLSLRMHYEIGSGLETGSFLVDNLSKFANQFYHLGIDDVIIFAALFCLICHISAREATVDSFSLVLAFVFALFYSIASVCLTLGSFSFFFANLYQFCLSLLSLAGLTVLFYFMLRILYIFMEIPSPEKEKALLYPMHKAGLIIFLCWLPWLLMNYPCSFCPDSSYQLMQWLGYESWSAHHPPFSTLIMGLCLSLGERIVDRNFGCFLYVLLQSVSGAMIFSYMLALLLRMGISRRVWIGLLIFFASPFWACYAQWFDKDFLYAQVFALCLCFILPVINTRRCSTKDALRIGATCVTVILLRKTGTYELIPALLLMGLWLKKFDRIRMLSAAAAVFVLCSSVSSLLYPKLGIEAGSVAEMLSIPFQQTAHYVNQFPDEVTEEERTAIDAVLIYDELDKYNPEISDFVKSNYRENGEALPEYFKHWFNMLLKHPISYFESAFMLSYGYFAPVRASLDAYMLPEFYPVLSEMDIFRPIGNGTVNLSSSLREIFIQFPLTKLLCMAGLYTWIFMACFVQLIRKKQFSSLLLFVPGIMNLLICIASPLCASTRYELPVIATIPLIIGVTLIKSKKQP